MRRFGPITGQAYRYLTHAHGRHGMHEHVRRDLPELTMCGDGEQRRVVTTQPMQTGTFRI